MSTLNAFHWREFVQPHRPPAPLTVGQNIKNIKEPRKILKNDAEDTRLVLNSAGRFVRTSMKNHNPSLSIAKKSDQFGEYE